MHVCVGIVAEWLMPEAKGHMIESTVTWPLQISVYLSIQKEERAFSLNH